MLSRTIAKDLKPSLANEDDFGQRLLKLTILCEQWPYRMAWLFVIVKNIQKETMLKDEWKQVVPAKINPHDKEDDKDVAEEEDVVYKKSSGNPVGKSLTAIILRLSQANKEDYEILDLPLLQVFHHLVQSLIHSPENPHIQLQRDADPQVFEILLSDPYARLTLKDLALEGCGKISEKTVRPYLFNLHRHMTEKVQVYLDNCMLHLVQNEDKIDFGVFQKKADFFNRKHPMPAPAPTN